MYQVNYSLRACQVSNDGYVSATESHSLQLGCDGWECFQQIFFKKMQETERESTCAGHVKSCGSSFPGGSTDGTPQAGAGAGLPLAE